MPTLAAIVLLLQVGARPQALDAGKLVLSNPSVVVELSGDRLPGFPVRLAWSPDGNEIYVRLVRRDRWANETILHYLISVPGGEIRTADREPVWAVIDWARKSAYSAPGLPQFRVESETRTEQVSPTNAGAGGALAQNSGDPYGPGFDLGPQGQAIIARAMQAQMVTTVTLKIKGQIVAQFINTQPMPGLLFGWAPEGFDAVAYADSKRRLMIMDHTGRRYQERATKGVLLPAWSPDGARIAWFEQASSRKFVLSVANVSQR
jgi:hypothetical protein